MCHYNQNYFDKKAFLRGRRKGQGKQMVLGTSKVLAVLCLFMVDIFGPVPSKK